MPTTKKSATPATLLRLAHLNIELHQPNHPHIQVNETAQYKWQFNWVEIFERLEGPFEGNLKYVLREEAPNGRPLLDFVKPKYYLPAASHPVFELAMYKGTPRKIAYNFSNFNPDGYNPDMCYIDWPPGNLMTPCTWLSCKKYIVCKRYHLAPSLSR